MRHLPEAAEMITRARNWKPREPQATVARPGSDLTALTGARRNQFVRPGAADRGASPLMVLVVKADPKDRRTIVETLMAREISAVPVDKLDDVKRQIASNCYDLVILDLSIGENEGLALLCDIRRRFDLPVIVTAAPHVGEHSRAAALELGADDCITKPFGLREFMARIRATLRRRDRRYDRFSRSARPAPVKPRQYRFGRWQLDRRKRQLTAADGTQVRLTKSEYGLLVAFVDNAMVILRREQLLQATRVHEDLCDRSIDVQILRLRRKLRVGPEPGSIIRTVRGAGYMFTLTVESIA